MSHCDRIPGALRKKRSFLTPIVRDAVHPGGRAWWEKGEVAGDLASSVMRQL